MPTKRRRHAVTETPPVEEALNALREESGSERVELGELVILGAREKLDRLRSERAGGGQALKRLAERIRARDLPLDPEAADEVKRTGWTSHP